MIKDFGVGVYLPDQNSCYESTNFSVLLYIKINALMEWYIQNNLVKIIACTSKVWSNIRLANARWSLRTLLIIKYYVVL